MARKAIVDTSTGALLVVDPPTREDGSVIMPEGVDASVIELTPAQEAQFEADAQAAINSTVAAATANESLKSQLKTTAQSAVGVALNALDTSQRNALIACLLYRAGALTSDLKIKPLNQWVV